MTPLFQGLQNLFGVLLSLNDDRINSGEEPKKLIPAKVSTERAEIIHKAASYDGQRNNLFGRTELIISSERDRAGNGTGKRTEAGNTRHSFP
jgi:hypothetical protein